MGSYTCTPVADLEGQNQRSSPKLVQNSVTVDLETELIKFCYLII